MMVFFQTAAILQKIWHFFSNGGFSKWGGVLTWGWEFEIEK
jgi:hypothetical protein